MSSQRQKRRDKQVAQENPINVSIIEDGIHKVISWKEYMETEAGKTAVQNVTPERVEEAVD